ncbi:serine hydrolase domain-containing protein [Chitinophaga varians]|uniref:serine hydrolase domain-containing protein n=1 Tax=Chitinophaga varians TaxID=2202339 RepID=UPI00165EC4B1|nr:serine hydrolase domain-containing protein [Chitinophaga varians]MBC9913339.1 beta-lactamase family protein [Chitinophaga varians]
MRASLSALLLMLFFSVTTTAQSFQTYADSLRQAHHIPALGYAVVSSDTILDIGMTGVCKINTNIPATIDHQFRIGSNTKAITCMIAAMLVQARVITWDTPFFMLFPGWKTSANKVYHHLTLQQLLTFRNNLAHYTYTYPLPRPQQITGSEANQRLQFARWLLQQPPVTDTGLNLTNSGYTLAGLMLEKASGKTYAQLLKVLGQQLHVHPGLGSPNVADSTQPWGHDAQGHPEPPAYQPKLNWLQAAGNIHISLRDYARFVQEQLRGLAGKSSLLPADVFQQLHFGLPGFAYGWFTNINAKGHAVSQNSGTPGTFVTTVKVIPAVNRTYIVFTNIQQENTTRVADTLLHTLEIKYGY